VARELELIDIDGDHRARADIRRPVGASAIVLNSVPIVKLESFIRAI
jgi:hypothetical protein